MMNTRNLLIARRDQRNTHSLMFRLAGGFIALVFLAIIVIAGLTLTGHMPGYHYEVTETYGNMTHHYEVGYGDDEDDSYGFGNNRGVGSYGYRH